MFEKFKMAHFNWLILAALMGAIVFLSYTNRQAKLLEDEINEINRKIAQERALIEAYKRDWEYLTTPSRILEKSARILPHMVEITPEQIFSLDKLTTHYGIKDYAQAPSTQAFKN
ncbi:MAG: hypothetical protein AB8B77_01595 [Alphaproteobacteria bacterium]